MDSFVISGKAKDVLTKKRIAEYSSKENKE